MKETDGRSPTIVEVSRRGKVSISSIYSRFDSKEALVGAALSRVVEEIDAEQRAMLTKAVRRARHLRLFIPRLIDGMSEFIRDNRSILRVLTQRAASDPESHHLAVMSYSRSLAQVSEVLLRYRREITCPDPEQAVRAIFRIVYATAAGFLGFGQGFDKAGIETWLQLKRDLEAVCILLLTAAI
jgi:AcrR family transcriptional regulator